MSGESGVEKKYSRLATLDSLVFNPARDGFGFQNPVGKALTQTGGGSFFRRLDSFLHGRGLCFGMSAAALLYFAERMADTSHPPLAELPLTPALLGNIRQRHLQQFWPRTVFSVIRDWLASGGGRPEHILGRIRLPGVDPNPHLLCFGPAFNQKFFYCFARAHAVVPYKVEEGRVYVYDPNYPRDRGRFVEFWRDGKSVEFAYGRFRSWEGWGITLVPASICTR